MKRGLMLLIAVAVLLGFSGVAYAFFDKIGTASFDSNNDGTYESYHLIYEGELGGLGLVWLDYTRSRDTWYDQVRWASNLSFTGEQITLDSGYTATMDWGTGWRLPSTDESKANLSGGFGYAGPDGNGNHNYRYGYNMVNSEMGHLFYESLGNKGYYARDGTAPQPDWGLVNRCEFNNLQAFYYWTGTEFSPNPSLAWLFPFYFGGQSQFGKDLNYYALAVRPGEVFFYPVPIPAAVWLFGSALIGLLGFRRKLLRR